MNLSHLHGVHFECEELGFGAYSTMRVSVLPSLLMVKDCCSLRHTCFSVIVSLGIYKPHMRLCLRAG